MLSYPGCINPASDTNERNISTRPQIVVKKGFELHVWVALHGFLRWFFAVPVSDPGLALPRARCQLVPDQTPLSGADSAPELHLVLGRQAPFGQKSLFARA